MVAYLSHLALKFIGKPLQLRLQQLVSRSVSIARVASTIIKQKNCCKVTFSTQLLRAVNHRFLVCKNSVFYHEVSNVEGSAQGNWDSR